MVYSLSYKRPAYVVPRRESFDSQTSGSVVSEASSQLPGVPAALSFDKIVNGGTCPPATIRDFMNYLIYVEHSAENLQFFLWFRDYSNRFANAQTTDVQLAPPWSQTQQESAVQAARAQKKLKMEGAGDFGKIFRSPEIEKATAATTSPHSKNPFNTPPRTPSENGGDRSSIKPWESLTVVTSPSSGSPTSAGQGSHSAESYRQQAAETFEAAGLRKPFTIQPFREEIDRIIVTYIQDDAPRQLNISYTERFALLRALQYTTHPSAFNAVNKTVESSLRRQSHPNFIRWSIINGNHARIVFAKGLGIATILLGLVAALVLTLSKAGRGYRALCAILWVIGIATLWAAVNGMCVVLHGMHHHHLKPWELFEDNENEMSEKHSFDSLASGSSNSYEDQPWIKKYEKRNIVRKIFDREVWVQEPALRQIQDTIFVQGLIVAAIGAVILTLIFLLVPGGHFF